MTAARDANRNGKTIYGIVTVGHYSRFYELLPGDELRDFSQHDGKPLHFQKDEMKIVAILQKLVELTL
jgi:hypothetical protein